MRQKKQALASVFRAGALLHVAIINQVFQNTRQTLLGDIQDIKQGGNRKAGVAVHEMQHPVVRPPEAIARQNPVWLAHKIAIAKKHQLDKLEIRRGAVDLSALASGTIVQQDGHIALHFNALSGC